MRKSFIFLAFILVFAMGQGAFAQCTISNAGVAPLTGGGNILAGIQTTVTIHVDAGCLPAGDGYSPTNGFTLYSDPADPDGQAAFGQVGGSLTAAFTGDLIFDFGPFNNYFVHDGATWIKQVVPFSTVNGDSVAVMWGGVASAGGHGMVSTFNDNAMTFFFTVPAEDSNTTVCIDQALTGVPGAVWKWAPVITTNPTIYPDWSGVECFNVEFVPNENPVIGNCAGATADADHCAPFTYTFEVTDNEDNAITVIELIGDGALGTVSKVGLTTFIPYTLNPVPIGGTLVGLVVDDGIAPVAFDTCWFTVTGTNAAPVCSAPVGALSVSAGTEKSQVVTATDDCDVMTYTIGTMYFNSVDDFLTATPATPVGGTNIVTAMDNLSAEVFFAPVAADAGFWWFDIVVDDGDAVMTCKVQWEVIIGGAYGVEIEKIHNQLQGNFTELAVNLTKMDTTMGLGGFDILIAYDPSALLFQQALEGDLYGPLPDGCGWEYFTYRFGPYGNCGNACPSGLVQVVGMAETNDGANHPDCDVPFFPDPLADPPTKVTMFYLKFLVSNDRTLNCQLVPVRFFWYDCTNNALSNSDGSLLYLSVGVYDYDNPNPINSLDVEFPTYLGAQEECYVGHDPTKPTPEANVDFQNGGVDIVCSDSIDAPGDININGIPYEIADAVMFTNYFISGPSAFGTHIDGSIAAGRCAAYGL